ncbi:hypothetical protein [Pelagibacterium sediminicola]|uniref:hypothetical protein n=1 Tax=Pelagibacterium sediminicola TaxID=2248761 RepID=UPI000E31B0F0|nr:hypothetical protein [Pelagibacterium sediminicola]
MTDLNDDTPLTLQEACDLIFRGNISPSTLRAESRRGRLVIERIGKRDFVTPSAIKEMRKRCEITGDSQRVRQPDLAEPERLKAARLALQLTAERLKKMPRK